MRINGGVNQSMVEVDNDTIKKNISTLIKKNHLTMARLSDMSGVPRSSLSTELRIGVDYARPIAKRTIYAVAAALHIPVETLTQRDLSKELDEEMGPETIPVQEDLASKEREYDVQEECLELQSIRLDFANMVSRLAPAVNTPDEMRAFSALLEVASWIYIGKDDCNG